mmetsp:Transcript_3698/g.8208  ORF Transcript_3698/g.8208 Transcript_3698/m.8208 type:complete len:102 (-) Transcript_3698:1205-1510(-)
MPVMEMPQKLSSKTNDIQAQYHSQESKPCSTIQFMSSTVIHDNYHNLLQSTDCYARQSDENPPYRSNCPWNNPINRTKSQFPNRGCSPARWRRSFRGTYLW